MEHETNSLLYGFFWLVGAIFSGCAYAILGLGSLALILRPAPKQITNSISIVGLVFAAFASLCAGAHVVEWIGLISATPFERHFLIHRATGPYALGYWLSFSAILLPILLWFGQFRQPLPSVLIAFGAMAPTFFEYLVRLIIFLHH